MGSRVPPALMTTRRPTRSVASASAPCSRTTVASAAMSAGSGRRPGPESGPVSRPNAGGSTTAPRRRRVATLSWVAGCSHISVCIAGAKTTGQDAVSRVAVSRSSARPAAARASRSAVAGATTTRSAFWPMRTCATSGTSDHTSVVTGLPDSASNVAAPTKWRAPGVGTTRTSWPASVNARSRKAALYAATPPLTPSTIELTRSILPAREGTRQSMPGAFSSVLGWLRPRARAEPARRGEDVVLSVLAGGVGQQTLVDLAERDRQRLLLRRGVHQGADVLQQALGELAVVGVDLAGTLGGEDDQAVLAAGALEQLVDRRVGDALGGRCDSGHGRACSSIGCGSERAGVDRRRPRSSWAPVPLHGAGFGRSQQPYQLVRGPGHVVVDHHDVELAGGVQLGLREGQPALLDGERFRSATGQPAHQLRP